MFPRKAQIAAVGLLALTCGCQGPPRVLPEEAAASDAGYVTPPAVSAAEPIAGGVILLGQAPAGAPVRLATPAGETLTIRTDSRGRWRLRIPAAADTRIFGLSSEAGGRRVQAEGYLLVGPRGETALLRAGVAALRLDHPGGSRIAAVDFDGEGGALLSGWAAAGTDVAVRLDGKPAGEARADDAGRFVYALPRLTRGPHRVEATGAAFSDVFVVDATPAAPLAAGPLHSQLTQHGLRADWLTPGGGVQSTILAS